MADDLATGFSPPDEEDPTAFHIHERHITSDPATGTLTFRVAWSYGKMVDDGEGGTVYQRIGRIRQRTWTAADVVAKVTTPDPGSVNTDLHSIAEQLLVADGHIEKA